MRMSAFMMALLAFGGAHAQQVSVHVRNVPACPIQIDEEHSRLLDPRQGSQFGNIAGDTSRMQSTRLVQRLGKDEMSFEVAFRNVSPQAVKVVEFAFQEADSDFAPVGPRSTASFERKLEPGRERTLQKTVSTKVPGYDLYVLSVTFEDGSTWTPPEGDES